ncbi:hypothetical protein LTR53_015337 [Teratosphaeriaceae sp. CCFEE 6253]|nr:hypothetical protein LTR53_015337 [Teratosphaeriaceae sp. CCFEE 6253]
MSYRLGVDIRSFEVDLADHASEIAKTGRAGCQAPHCKKQDIKIEKGEIRQGVLVTIQEHQSMKWRHWGCVTPEVIHNWKEASGDDMDMVDGYDELPTDVQAKVERAFEQGHVDDEDWNGDIEMNRWTGKTKQGMFVKTPKSNKNAKKSEDDGVNADANDISAKANKKRGRSKVDEDDGDDDGAVKLPARRGRGKKAVKAETSDVDHDEPDSAPPAKKSRKAAKVKNEDADEQEAAPKPATKRARGKKTKSDEIVKDEADEVAPEKSSPAKRSRSKKVAPLVNDEDDGDELSGIKAKPAKRKNRGKKATAAGDE